MTIRELVKNEIDMLPDDALDDVRDFVLSQKERFADPNGIPFDAVVPQEKPSELPFGRGCMKGKMWMSDDFDAPLEDFREYME